MNFYKPICKEIFYTYKNKFTIQSYWVLNDERFNKLINYTFNKNNFKLESKFYSVMYNEIYLDYEFQYNFGYKFSGDLDLCLCYCKEYLSNIISYDRFQELMLRDFNHI